MTAQLNENTQYTDPTTGELLSNGLVYVGQDGLDAELNPIIIYADKDLTIPLLNPQRTGDDGRVSNKIYIPGKYSLKVKNSGNVQKLNDPSLGEISAIGNTILTNIQGSDSIVANASPAIDALVDNQTYVLTTVAANSGAMTLTIDLTPTYPIKKHHDIDVEPGDIEDHQILAVIWNETDSVFEVTTNTALDVRAAINDLDTEKASLAGDNSYTGTAQYAAGEGIVFNGDAISAANTLDDYEEGTFTPTYIGSTTPGDHAYSTQVGRYEKIGRQVSFRCRVILSAKGTIAGNISLGGLPFTTSSAISTYGSISIGNAASFSITAGENFAGYMNINSTEIALRHWDIASGMSSLTDTQLTNTSQLMIAGQYNVD